MLPSSAPAYYLPRHPVDAGSRPCLELIGEPASTFCEQGLAPASAGGVFTAAVRALDARRRDRLDRSLRGCGGRAGGAPRSDGRIRLGGAGAAAGRRGRLPRLLPRLPPPRRRDGMRNASRRSGRRAATALSRIRTPTCASARSAPSGSSGCGASSRPAPTRPTRTPAAGSAGRGPRRCSASGGPPPSWPAWRSRPARRQRPPSHSCCRR